MSNYSQAAGPVAGPTGKPADGGTARPALTSTEARQLAASLLGQAAAEYPDSAAQAGRVEVSYLGGETYAAATRGQVVTDQPAAAAATIPR